MTPAIIPLTAYKRVPLDINIPFMGVNYAGATLRCEIRNNPGDQGDALITLTNATPPAQGLSVTYDAAYPDPEGTFPNGASIVRLIISEATLEALSYAADPSAPLVLHYDIHLTPSGGIKDIYSAGTFTIQPGVTL